MIFIDTGALVARYIKRDQFHKKAVRAWERIGTEGLRCYTSNFVLDETLTLLARRAGGGFAAERARHIYSSRILTILRPVEQVELKAVALLGKFGDQNVSFTDCVSFVLMRSHRITRAFAFDRHFEAAGFELWPDEGSPAGSSTPRT